MCMWEMEAVPNSTVRKVNYKKNIHRMNQFSFLLSHSLVFFVYPSFFILLCVGAVCVRVPSSLKAGVELCGASVEISPEVVLHGVENNTTQGQTTVTGETLIYITSHSTVN